MGHMTSPDEYDYVVLEVLRGIDFAIKTNQRLKDLPYSLSQNDPKSINFQIVFSHLKKNKIISLSKEWPFSISGNTEQIGIIIRFSIIDKNKFDKLFLELSQKYKNDARKNNKVSITIGQKGIYLTLDKKRIYEVDGGRKKLIHILTDGPRQIKSMIGGNNFKNDKYIISSVANINLRFSKNVMKKIGEQIIINTSIGYALNTDEYDIRLE